MRVLLLGGNGYLGPHVVAELERDHELVLTDITPIQTPHAAMAVDIADPEQVRAAARGTDAIVNCSVQRRDGRGAFAVNTLGTMNALRVAVDLGHRRFVNTGPRFTLVGNTYLDFDHDITEEIPPQPGTGLYALTKSLGHELCRVYSEQHPIHVLMLLFSSFRDLPSPDQEPGDANPFAVTFADAARAIRCALEVDLATLPSPFETFFTTVDQPQQHCRCGKARRLLGWEPRDDLSGYVRRG